MQCDLARLCLPEVQYGIVSPYSALNTAVEEGGETEFISIMPVCLAGLLRSKYGATSAYESEDIHKRGVAFYFPANKRRCTNRVGPSTMTDTSDHEHNRGGCFTKITPPS